MLETEVHTDTSAIRLEKVLFQKHGKKRPMVTYYSRKTTPEEQKYHSYYLEELAAFMALKTIRVYLLGIRFTAVTDCSAIHATTNKRNIQPRELAGGCFVGL